MDLTPGFSQNSGMFRILYEPAAFEYMTLLYRNRNRYDSLRYIGCDYSSPGKYFVTICTGQMEKWFGDIINGEMHLSGIGHIASQMWYEIPDHFPFIGLDELVVMPNHIHGIIIINRFIGTQIVGALHATPLPPNDSTHLSKETMSFISPKPGSLSVVVRSYKSAVTKNAHKFDNAFYWQPGFYDNIICTAGQLKRIKKYVLDNPQNWNDNE
jgi:REP element-mobilizing transposase RayT